VTQTSVLDSPNPHLHWMHAADNTIVKGTGKEVALHLSKAEFPGVVVVHSKNDDEAKVMSKILPTAKVARFGEFEIAMTEVVRPRRRF